MNDFKIKSTIEMVVEINDIETNTDETNGNNAIGICNDKETCEKPQQLYNDFPIWSAHKVAAKRKKGR